MLQPAIGDPLVEGLGVGQKESGESPSHREVIKLLSALTLKFEDELSLIRLDRGFVMYQRTQATQSILSMMFELSTEWRQQQKEGKVKSSLRLTLFRCFMTELQARLDSMDYKPEAVAQSLQMQWTVKDAEEKLMWHYLKYDADKKEEIPDQDRKPLLHQTAMEAVKTIIQSANEDTLHRFNATRPMSASYAGDTLCFLIQVSLRGQEAQMLHEALTTLAQSAILNLMGARIRRERIHRAPGAVKLSKLLGNMSEPWCCSIPPMFATKTPSFLASCGPIHIAQGQLIMLMLSLEAP